MFGKEGKRLMSKQRPRHRQWIMKKAATCIFQWRSKPAKNFIEEQIYIRRCRLATGSPYIIHQHLQPSILLGSIFLWNTAHVFFFVHPGLSSRPPSQQPSVQDISRNFFTPLYFLLHLINKKKIVKQLIPQNNIKLTL